MRLVTSWLIVLADVTVDPTTNGMPGAGLIQQILNWLAQAALWGSLGAILAGAGLFWVGHQAGNFAGRVAWQDARRSRGPSGRALRVSRRLR